ncbi:hypothetical protein CDAR_612201 [Caerostris darwini]|uniref:Uncharacterized protein n=1 Tax=Caerostris darwini TaxID=1538125 RepID=A0AAV4S1X7_9ARAC|nr:hypothetical protein CDAR_612201 [Caerostris darwini]
MLKNNRYLPGSLSTLRQKTSPPLSSSTWVSKRSACVFHHPFSRRPHPSQGQRSRAASLRCPPKETDRLEEDPFLYRPPADDKSHLPPRLSNLVQFSQLLF